jgi:PAS domain S-box-containing protein
MSIRIKTLILVSFTVLLSTIGFYLLLYRSITTTYKTLEEKLAKEDVERLVEALNAEVTSLSSKTGDWANWDDSYNFVQGKDKNFVEINYQEPSFEQLKVNAIIFLGNDRKIFFLKEYDLKNKRFTSVNSIWNKLLTQEVIFQKEVDKSTEGIVVLDGTPMMIAAKPILTSAGEGPIAGTLVMARYLDPEMIDYLSKIVKSPLSLINSPNNNFGLNKNNKITIKIVDNNNLNGYALINDIFGNPSVIFRENLTRDIYNYGLGSLRSFLISFIIFGFIFTIIIVILLEHYLLSKVLRLSLQVAKIGPKNNPPLRVDRYGKDEIGKLAMNINTTLDALEKLNEKVSYESSQRKSILETMGEGVVVTDPKGKIIYTNPAFIGLMGYSSRETVGKIFNKIFPAYNLQEKPLPQNFLEDKKAQIAKGSQVKVLLMGKKEKKAVIINTAPIIVSRRKMGVVRVFYNYSAELELTRQKDDFFSIASHELRTPLTIIAGNLDNIIRGYGGSKLTEFDNSVMNDIIRSSDRLVAMINDFLNVSRLDQGRLRLDIKPVSICSLTDKIISEMNPLFNEKGLILKFICDRKHANVIADEDKLRQVMVNLLGNALKFTSKGSVLVNHKVENNMLITELADMGMGIDKDKQKLLFQRFQQAMGGGTLYHQPGGTGLGLYISKEFIKLMGGDMWLIKSEPGHGSTFAFSLPLEKQPLNKDIENISQKIQN